MQIILIHYYYMQDNNSGIAKTVKFLGLNVILPIAISTVTLIIQYHTGFFDPTKGSPLNPVTLFLITFFFINFLVSLNRLKTVWFNSHKYFREDFSLASLGVTTWIVSIVIMCVMTRIMPWHICLGFFQVFSNQKVSLPPASIEGYLLLLLFGTLIFILISQTYRGWKGQKSTQQYESEQRSEISNFFVEGLAELSRKIKQTYPLVPYSEIDPNRLASPLESVTDSLSWEEQARELLRLSSSSYAFDHNSWHDRQECWVGENVNTNELIFLYPVQSSLDNQSLNNYRQYARQIAQNKQKEVGEIVVAFQSQASFLATPECSDICFKTQDSFLDNLVNFTDYKNEIRKRVMVSKLPESELTLNQVYTPSEFLQEDSSKEIKLSNYVENYLKEWLQESSRKQIALLGGYGQGKSSTTLILTYQLLFENPQKNTRIPLLIELRGMSPRNLTPLTLLGAWASPYRIDPQALMRLLIAGRLLLIFEGFDEMALIGNMEARRKHFETLWKFCYPQNKILITGRPNFFLDDQEMKKALGIDKPIGENPYCEAIRIAPFSVEQIGKSLREQPRIQSQIVDLAKKNTRFRDLVSRPSLLHVVSVLWEKENFANQVARLNSAYFMERFVNGSYRRQGLKNQDSQEFMALNSSERSYFMSGIACYMAANKLNNQIPSEKLNQVIEELIDCIPDSVSTVSSIGGEETRPLKIRIQNQEPKEAVEHIKTDTRTCGLLVDDPATPGTFKFGHKSFMEYLFAATMAEYINNTKSEKARAILKATDASLTDLLDLPVSIEFLSELIGVNHNLEINGSSSSETSSQLKSERIFAKKLLNVIRFGHKKQILINLMYDFILFDQIYFNSANFIEKSHKYSFSKRLLIRSSSPVIYVYFFSIFIFFVLRFSTSKYSGYFLSSTITIAITTMFYITFMRSYFEILFKRVLQNKNSNNMLWNYLCKMIGIKDIVLHKVAGTAFLPWAKNQPFIYFLSEEQIQKLNQSSE
jgi:hypothetical protein